MGISIDLNEIQEFREAFESVRAEAYRRSQIGLPRKLIEVRFGHGALSPAAEAALVGMASDDLVSVCSRVREASSADEAVLGTDGK